ncbi:MAG TPA: PAC2 family protein [Nitrososphaerales archaeon]|nr:PAC2 family protein [Nitrososphaerales archaeon]
MKFDSKQLPKLKSPVLLVATSTSLQQYRALYSQARELAKYMLAKMTFDRVATVHSSAFAPEILVREDGLGVLPACHIYLHRGRRDILLLSGDSSPMDDQHEFSRAVLEFASRVGVKEVFSIGARWADNPVSPFQDPEINGFASSKAGAERLEKNGAKLIKGEPAPFFASMVVGLAPGYGMEGYKISVDHGEPIPHARTVVRMLEILEKMIGFEIDMDELKSRIVAPPSTNLPEDGGIYH